MWFRLTLTLGHRSVREAQQHIGADEFAEWLAYYTLEPFGPRRDDQRIGTLAAVLANLYSKKRGKKYKWSDFFPEPKVKKEQTPEQMLKIVEMLNAAFGGDDRRSNRGGS